VTRRLIISYLAVTFVVLLLLEVPLAVFYAQRELERLTSAVERDAAVVATIYEDDLEAGLAPDPSPARIYEQRTGARVVVVDAQGISLIDTEQPTPRDFSTRPEIATALTGERSAGTRRSETLDTELLYVAIPVASGGVVHGALRITLDTAQVDGHVHRFWWGLAAIGLIVIAAMSLVGWLVARSVTLPLRRLNDTARRFGGGDLSVDQGSPDGPPELRELSETMATMAGRLAVLIDEQRAFVADASHQLRTPLTGLRLRLENLQAGLDVADAAQVDAAIEEISRLSALVTDLLQLARADRHSSVEPHDLARLTAERVDTWSAVTDAAGIGLRLASDGSSLVVSAVPGAIEQIIDNLLDNALAASPAGSTIEVTVSRGTETHRLVVGDRGPGLSDQDKERATRRFWRGDTTRSGSGLGLAIATSLATASGGALTLGDNAGGGLAVTVGFPVEPGPPRGRPSMNE
jgi:signal transduction histidine kinase